MYTVEAQDGVVTDWHVVHYASRAVGGFGTVIVEATAVTPEGRLSPNDLGLWSDEQVAGQRRLVEAIHAGGALAGIQIGRGEPIKDTARVISRMCDLIMARVNRHETLEELAKFSRVPVINGLSDKFHPAQLMADLMTAVEFGLKIDEIKAAFVGDGNNMTHSWLMLASKLGFELRIATPKGYEPDADVVNLAMRNAQISGAKIYLTQDVKEAVSGANVVTTDTWVSMGQEAEKEKRLKDFAGFCVDENLMKLAAPRAIFLHCLPAYRGYEVSEAVFEKHADEIFSEAENRLHAQKGVMVWLDERRI